MRLQPPQLQPGKGRTDLGTFVAYLERIWITLLAVVNGRIGFGSVGNPDNIDGTLVTATTVAGNFTVTHNLLRSPTGYWMVTSDAFENLKFISSTTTQITLAGQNGGAHITLFIF